MRFGPSYQYLWKQPVDFVVRTVEETTKPMIIPALNELVYRSSAEVYNKTDINFPHHTIAEALDVSKNEEFSDFGGNPRKSTRLYTNSHHNNYNIISTCKSYGRFQLCFWLKPEVYCEKELAENGKICSRKT
ncbi:cellulose synthase catalytic subunit [Anopheles sinensis]|uniref:Cellulose synthase catalytic subunit n=1 Tax=Anopheles sinensis TaxID=74873 RepID=A0A084VBD4_ANOSI|nr:cellulose synthase catalytic subunit [Anopheles sinensis]